MIERLIVVALFDGVDLLDVTGPAEVFALVQREMDEPSGYRVVLASESLDAVTTSAGVRVLPDTTFADIADGSIDTLIVPGAVTIGPERQVRAVADPAVVAWIRRLAPNTRRVASVCVGAHMLADAGLLSGKRATTHWSTSAQLATEHPDVVVDADPIFIRDGDVWTGAGLTACLDLALALVADDLGQELALRVARQLVMYLKRPSGQSQFSVPLLQTSTSRRVDELRLYITTHLAESLTVPYLAERLHISDRQLTRIFTSELGTTPAVYIETARVEAARNQLEVSDDTLDHVAQRNGFGTVDTLNRAFRRRLNTTPAEYRNRFRVR